MDAPVRTGAGVLPERRAARESPRRSTAASWCRSTTPRSTAWRWATPPPWRKLHGARIYLLHVEEGVTSQVYGQESSTAEVEAGEEYLERIAQIAAGSRD